MKRLISFSLYGDKPDYFRGAIRNAEMRERFYPGWTCRFYVSPEIPQDLTRRLKSLGADVVCMDGADANRIPPMFWRLLAVGEKGVEFCLVRDADSRPSERESRMVDEWLASGKTFHIIRDHPQHAKPIMGGLWGCACKSVAWMQDLVRNEAPKYGTDYDADQKFLRYCVYPKIKNSVLIHSRFVRYPGEKVLSPPPWEEPRPYAAGARMDGNTVAVWRHYHWHPRALLTHPAPARLLFLHGVERFARPAGALGHSHQKANILSFFIESAARA